MKTKMAQAFHCFLKKLKSLDKCNMKRRIIYLFIIFTVILLGLASRKFSTPDSWVHLYMGDMLWAMLFYFIFRFIFIKINSNTILLLTLIWCFSIEISQLYHVTWLDAIRQTTLGGLLLGFGFLWSDLLCYIAGVLIGFGLDKFRLTQRFTT
jgi:Protein of unknown function (DUF2809)